MFNVHMPLHSASSICSCIKLLLLNPLVRFKNFTDQACSQTILYPQAHCFSTNNLILQHVFIILVYMQNEAACPV